MTLRQWLSEIKDPIEGLVLGPVYSWRLVDGEVDAHANLYGRVVSVEEAAPVLDVEFDDGYGGAESHPCYAWTAGLVYFVNTYDGSEWLASVPRHPGPCEPQHHGGG